MSRPCSSTTPSRAVAASASSILAVRWRGASSAEQRRTWLGEAGAELLTAAKDAVAPLAQVNQTDGLSWVRGGVGLRKLESSDAVEWVAPPCGPSRPTRLSGQPSRTRSRHVHRQSVALLRSPGTCRHGTRGGTQGHRRIGRCEPAGAAARHATAQVDGASFSAGRSTVHVACSFAKALGSRQRAGRYPLRDHSTALAAAHTR